MRKKKIRNELSVKPFTHPDFPQSQSFDVYQETDSWFRVPRVWGVNNFSKAQLDLMKDNSSENLTFTGTIRKDQETAYTTTINYLTNNHTGVLCLPTGKGKTFYIYCRNVQLEKKRL